MIGKILTNKHQVLGLKKKESLRREFQWKINIFSLLNPRPLPYQGNAIPLSHGGKTINESFNSILKLIFKLINYF